MKISMTEKQSYELLCIDVANKCVAQTERALCYALLSHSDMFKEPLLTNDHTITDSKQSLTVTVKHVKPDEELTNALQGEFLVFLIRATGPFSVIESLRLELLKHLKEQKFDQLYVLLDDVSSTIAKDVYPRINEVENALRKYLMKFFITKVGPNWWMKTADAEMQKKIGTRKNNENNFSAFADGKAYLIDFGELGKIVYTLSSGFVNKEDIYERVMKLDESPEAVQAIKRDLQSNYTKFFKDSFKDRDFQKKWEDLEKIRHKVAHNSLFVLNDQMAAEQLSSELIAIIRDANKTIDQLKFSQDEREAIMERIVGNSQTFRSITRDEMLARLSDSERWASRNSNGFIGLMSYVKTYLGNAGYDYGSCFDVLRELEHEGLIEVYEHRGEGHERSVKAVRILRPGEYRNRPLGDLRDILGPKGTPPPKAA